MAEEPRWEVFASTGAGGTLLRVRLTPRASREGIEGVVGDRLVIRVNAPPVEGKANRALVRLLAETFGFRPSAAAVVRGEASRNKTVFVSGWAPPRSMPAEKA